jgi:2-polyprenyl-6-methoxyphenol hydroxylase-like FAD-dependent oxidoreductase
VTRFGPEHLIFKQRIFSRRQFTIRFFYRYQLSSLIIMSASNAPPVIVVGASLVGLSAALCLTSHQVPTIVLEKHAGISPHPRAIGFTARTMEIYHSLGIRNEHPAPDNFELKRLRVESLTGKWFEQTSWSDTQKKQNSKQTTSEIQQQGTPSRKKEYSASRATALPQDKLEPILESLALERGTDIRRQHNVLKVEQDQNGVTVTAQDSQGATHQIKGSYLIAADGNRSTIRENLQIPRQGRGFMQNLHSVLFHAPLEQFTKGIVQFEIDQPNLKALLVSYSDGRWALMFRDDIERDNAALISAIYQAIGDTSVPVDIITTGRWELTALVADTFQSGRVFLAGDAAHTLPPNRGGYGANTGIHDVHNLAWKLAAVLAGRSSEGLLETYDAERRPVALLRHDQIFVRADYKVHLDAKSVAGEKIDDDAMEFGQIYVSKGFVGVDGDLPCAKKPDEWAGQPGTHLPHFWVERDGERFSSLAVVGQNSWTLISASEDWGKVVLSVNGKSRSAIRSVRLDEQLKVFRGAFSVSETGAALIRPDGYIAWKIEEMPSGPFGVLVEVLSQVAFEVNA